MINPKNSSYIRERVVKVFFETAGYAEEFCTYTNEAEYIADLPRLEKLAREMGYDYVTETID